jgi:hypothetical protein
MTPPFAGRMLPCLAVLFAAAIPGSIEAQRLRRERSLAGRRGAANESPPESGVLHGAGGEREN